MQISYQLTADDYRQAYYAFRNRKASKRWSIRILYVVFVILVLTDILLLAFSPERFSNSLVPLYLVTLFWAYYLFYCPAMIGRKMMKTSPSAKSPRTLEITDAGMHDHNEVADSKVAWSAHTGWAENDRVFILLYSSISFVPIPKRAMTPDQQNEFRELLKRHVKPT